MDRRTPEDARAFIDGSDFIWHQIFDLAEGVPTPGVQSVASLLDLAELPRDLSGLTAIDIGTTNGGAAFELEARGASRVVAVDVVAPSHFGFEAIRDFLGSSVEFVQESVYRLPWALDEQFDVVIFTGVLYHLRHPLLALDAVRDLTRGFGVIESAVCDFEIPEHADGAYSRFYRRDELAGDWTNWFAPTCALMTDWMESCGLEPELKGAWPEEAPQRALATFKRADGDPEFRIGHEPRIERLQ